MKTPPKILDGTFYTIEQIDNGKIVARCAECGEQKKGNIFSTGNFINHYKSKHEPRVKELEDFLKNTQPENEKEKTTTVRQPAITQCFSENVTAEVVRAGF